MNKQAAAALSIGLAAHKAGRLSDARRAYEAALALAPNDADALHLYGVLLGAMGEGERGVAMLRRAVTLNPRYTAAHFNLGCLLQRLQKSADAESAFRKALAVQPDFPEALLNLGNLLLLRGEIDEAIDRLEKALALEPRLVDARHSLGLALQKAGRISRASEVLAAAAPSKAESLSALFALADDAIAKEAWSDAVQAYRLALSIDPSRAAAQCNLGNALKALHRLPEAEQAYRAALALRPSSAPILNNLAIVVQEQQRIEEAIEHFRSAIAADPAYADAYVSLAPALQRLNRHEEAAEACLAALRIEPGKHEAHSNLGNVRLAQNRVQDAIAAFEDAARLAPACAAYTKNLSHALLLAGVFRRGWACYEARWQDTMKAGFRSFQAHPAWSGTEPIEGKRFFVHAEQGIGDTIQFMRYVPLLSARGANVTLEVQAALLELAQGFGGVTHMIARGEAMPEFDLHCPLMSLPAAFGTELGTVPSQVPYLSADPAKVVEWKRRLGALSDKPKVGLTWAGNPNHRNDHNRSVAFAQLAPLLQSDSATFIPLQKEIRHDEREAVLASGFAVDADKELATFSDTAALISALDVVVSVDTSVAHLAGALGKPVWILLPFSPDWRWLLDREDSPWYPTARLFRQPRPGDWDSPIASIGKALRSLR